MTRGQTATAYTPTGGVCMVDNDKVKQEIEVVHTVPKMTQAERIVAEKRVSSDLFEVLTDIYVKLNIAEEDKKDVKRIHK